MPGAVRSFQIPLTRSASQTQSAPFTISRSRPCGHKTREAIEVTFAVPEHLRDSYRFVPGQFLTLETSIDGEDVRRSYSICAPPSAGELRIAIKRVAGGAFSRFAHEALEPGATLRVGPPDGRFFVEHDAAFEKHYLAIAAGSGITPIVAIVRHVLETESKSRVTLVYGNRSSSSVMFREELQALKDRYLGRFVLVFVMSREAQDIDLFAGRIDRAKMDALLETWIDPAIDVAFICGPEAMNEAVIASLEAHDVPRENIKTELFAAGTRAKRQSGAVVSDAVETGIAATVVLDGRKRSFTIASSNETVLEAGLRQGIDLPYSCKGGVCSTCRAVLVEGEVEMDVHYALEDYEIARGLILMCQSFPVTETIAVDVDLGAG